MGCFNTYIFYNVRITILTKQKNNQYYLIGIFLPREIPMSSKVFIPQGTNQTPFNPQLQHFDYICGQVIKENRLLKIKRPDLFGR